MDQLQECARALLARAVGLAQQREDVDIDWPHLLAIASPAVMQSAPKLVPFQLVLKPVPKNPNTGLTSKARAFTPTVRRALKGAYQLASSQGSRAVSEENILQALIRLIGASAGCADGMMASFSVDNKVRGGPLSSLFDTDTVVMLKSKGIDTPQLLVDLENFTLLECLLTQTEFWRSEAGRRLFHLSFALGSQCPILFALLGCMMCLGPATAPLARAGCSQVLLVQLLQSKTQNSTPMPRVPNYQEYLLCPYD